MAAPIHDPLRDLDRELRQRRHPVEVAAPGVVPNRSVPTPEATFTPASDAQSKRDATQLLASIDARLARIENQMPKGGIGMGVFRGLLLWQALHIAIAMTLLTVLWISGYTAAKLAAKYGNPPTSQRTTTPAR